MWHWRFLRQSLLITVFPASYQTYRTLLYSWFFSCHHYNYWNFYTQSSEKWERSSMKNLLLSILRWLLDAGRLLRFGRSPKCFSLVFPCSPCGRLSVCWPRYGLVSWPKQTESLSQCQHCPQKPWKGRSGYRERMNGFQSVFNFNKYAIL